MILKENITRFFPIVLAIFHIIGLVLFTQSENASDLTWLNLLLCASLVFLAEFGQNNSVLIMLIIAFGGFFIELIGTKTGLLFGEYSYGEGLGWRVLGVSIMIAANWYAIVLAASNVARLFKANVFLQALIAAFFCVALDFAIEPVAIKFDFWSWKNGEIPLFNYITWFAFAFGFSYLYLKNSRKLNKTALWLFVIWLLFFTILNFFNL